MCKKEKENLVRSVSFKERLRQIGLGIRYLNIGKHQFQHTTQNPTFSHIKKILRRFFIVSPTQIQDQSGKPVVKHLGSYYGLIFFFKQ